MNPTQPPPARPITPQENPGRCRVHSGHAPPLPDLLAFARAERWGFTGTANAIADIIRQDARNLTRNSTP